MKLSKHKQAMKKIRAKLTRVIMLHEIHCGHDGAVAKAMHEALALEDMIERAMIEAFEEGRSYERDRPITLSFEQTDHSTPRDATPTPPC